MFIKNRKDFLSSTFLLVLGILMAFRSTKLSIWSKFGPDEGFLPLVIALIIIGLSLMISMKSLSLRREKEIEDILLKKRDRETMNISRVFFYIVLSMFYGLLLDKVGFLITSGLFLIMILRFVEKQTWKMAILVSVTSVTVCYLLFVYFLEVHLPIGFIR